MFQDDGIACHDGRDNRVHRDQIGIVPRGDGEHDAKRLAPHPAAETFLRPCVDVGECFLGNRDHVAGAFFEAAQLACAIGDGAAHLPGKLRYDLVSHGKESVDEAQTKRRTLGDGNELPCRLCRFRSRQRAVYFCPSGQRALGIDAPIDRRDDFQNFTHPRSNPLISSQSVTRRSYSCCSQRPVWR